MTSAFPAPALRWVVAPPPEPGVADALAAALGVPVLLASLLAQRGLTEPDLARRFLRPGLDELSDPMALAGMAAAVDAVGAAVRAGRRILVHGDYDVDGQCATALLVRALRAAGADAVPFVPHRLRDGYDFGPAGLAAAREAGVGLIVTCDCGITAIETARAARAAGIDLIVTDHHLPGAELPEALAVVDPQRSDDTSGARELCGTGVALKLVQALVPALGLPDNLPMHLLDLAALATVADVVPLTGENRLIVRHGLKLLADSRWPGLRALVHSSGLEGKDIRASHLGFVLGPRLNAAGRVGDAADGLRLLLADQDDEAEGLARRLEAMNVQRQALDQRTLEEALERVEREGDPNRDAAFVLAGEGWHAGVVGIVASRVVERYGRPTFLIALDGDIGKGSGRSISRFDLHAALTECGDLLERFGGHRMAAGLTIRRAQLEAFGDRFRALARARLDPAELAPEQRVDLVVQLGDVDGDLERLMRHLEPCGMGNPAPVFGVRAARLEGRRVVGNGHLKGLLRDATGSLDAIGFQLAERTVGPEDAPVDAAFRLERNEWQGRVTLQARLLSLVPSVAAASLLPSPSALLPPLASR